MEIAFLLFRGRLFPIRFRAFIWLDALLQMRLICVLKFRSESISTLSNLAEFSGIIFISPILNTGFLSNFFYQLQWLGIYLELGYLAEFQTPRG